jgi:acetolactate synthase I/II/III large subunit
MSVNLNLEEPILQTEREVRLAKQNISGSEAVILSLLAEGVDTVFGYPGGAIMPIYDALYDYKDRLKHYLVRHEQGAAHAAQGYARVQKRAGVCFATSGPGATNLITGIADAMIDSTPLVCITGQVFKHLLGTDAFQETDVVGISMPVTKWNYQVTSASEIPEAIAKAFFIAQTGRPGPVLLDITKNAQVEKFDFEYKKCVRIRSYKPLRPLSKQAIEDAAALIAQAKKPFMLVGQGVLLSRAEEELKAFAEKSGIPVASTLLGLSAFSTKHPLYVGYLGMHGNYGPNIKTNECDLLIAVGMRFDDRVTGNLAKYAKQAKIIHIDIDPSEINKNVKVNVPILADAKEALVALTQKIEANSYPEWLEEFHKCDTLEYQKVISKDFAPVGEKIKMAEVIKMLSDKTEGKAIIVTDVGQHQMVTTRYYEFDQPYSNITSGGLGTMGFALPASIGAKVGCPDRQVVAVIGDGGFQMTIQELGTVMQYKIPIKIIILNNNFLGMVRQWQQLFFDKRYSFVEIENPDFVKVVDGYRIKARRIEKREDLSAALDEMLASDTTYFMDITVENEENVFPMVAAGDGVSDIRLE